MDQFKIPVDVQVEDKIVGPLTLRHLIITGVGSGISYFLYILLQPKYIWTVWVPPIVLVIGLTLAIAFVKIHDMTFFQFILATIEFNFLPKKRMWQKGSGDVYESFVSPPKVKKQNTPNKQNKANEFSEKKINELTKILDETTASPEKK